MTEATMKKVRLLNSVLSCPLSVGSSRAHLPPVTLPETPGGSPGLLATHFSVHWHFRRFRIFIFDNRIQGCRIPSQRTRREQVVVCGHDEFRVLHHSWSHLFNRSVLLVARY